MSGPEDGVAANPTVNPDALPQPLGELKPIDEWQRHMNDLFYGLRGGRLRDYFQTFSSADYRLAHALAKDYYTRALKRDQEQKGTGTAQTRSQSPAPLSPGEKGTVPFSDAEKGTVPPSRLTPHVSRLTVVQLGAGNGNLAACFLSHLKRLDQEGRLYPRIRYLLVDTHAQTLAQAQAHPDLAEHRERIEAVAASVQEIPSVPDGTVDFVLCDEVWNELPTKLLLRHGTEVEEEYVCPNLTAARHDAISDWSGFVRAFKEKDLAALQGFPPFLEDLIWEREYRKTEWKDVPYRKTIMECLKGVDETVLVPVNLGAFATVKEARRVLAPDAVGCSFFDAGATDSKVLNDPDKPCYGQFGGQYSFMVNYPLVEAVARYLGFPSVATECQRDFVGRMLGANVITLMDLLSMHPRGAALKGWEQDQLILETIAALNATYRSPYRRRLELPLHEDAPPGRREGLQQRLASLNPDGVPDTVAYVTEEEALAARGALEGLGYDWADVEIAFTAPPQPVDYQHFFCRR